MPAELLQLMLKHFGCEPVETYGLTEGGANVLTPRWGIKKLGSGPSFLEAPRCIQEGLAGVSKNGSHHRGPADLQETPP